MFKRLTKVEKIAVVTILVGWGGYCVSDQARGRSTKTSDLAAQPGEICFVQDQTVGAISQEKLEEFQRVLGKGKARGDQEEASDLLANQPGYRVLQLQQAKILDRGTGFAGIHEYRRIKLIDEGSYVWVATNSLRSCDKAPK